jgi:hypothetical protein
MLPCSPHPNELTLGHMGGETRATAPLPFLHPPSQAGTLACPVPQELQKYEMWSLCGGVPEGLNPRSLRAELGHNTNVWVAKGDGLKFLKFQGISGILDPKDPVDKYFREWGRRQGAE